MFPKRPLIPSNDPPEAHKNPCNPPDFKWHFIDQINISGQFSPSSKRFLSVREWPENGLAKVRSIRSEINLSHTFISYNYLILNNISIIIECTYQVFENHRHINQQFPFEMCNTPLGQIG